MVSTPPDGFFKLMAKTHSFLYRLSKGKIWGRQGELPVLLLTTTGRKSGHLRTNPVLYQQDNDDYLVAASKGGSDRNPAWFLNLKSNPRVFIEIGDKKIPATAHVVTGDDRDKFFDMFKAKGHFYADYEKMTQRVIPVVRLIPG